MAEGRLHDHASGCVCVCVSKMYSKSSLAVCSARSYLALCTARYFAMRCIRKPVAGIYVPISNVSMALRYTFILWLALWYRYITISHANQLRRNNLFCNCVAFQYPIFLSRLSPLLITNVVGSSFWPVCTYFWFICIWQMSFVRKF